MPLDLPVAARTLPNGLRVVVSEDHAVPSVSMSLWVDVGSRHEQAGRTGLAHLFEHLMFQGSELVAEGEHMASLMAHGGRANATTSFDRTAYVQSVPRNCLDLALWLEADRQGHLLPALTQENLDNQRDVVVEEKRQRYDTVPYGTALLLLGELLFPAGHPYAHPTIGSMADLAAAGLEDAHAFYRAHYGPRTSILTLVGDLTADEGFGLAERYFGHLEDATTARPPTTAALPPLQTPARTVVTDEGVPSERIYLAARLPAVTDEEFLACALALDALATLSISRVHESLVRGSEVASGASATALGLRDGTSIGLIVVDVTEGTDPAEVEQQLAELLRDFAVTGPREVELEASRADSERSWLEALAGYDERAELLSRAALLFGDAGQVNDHLDRVLAVTGDQVRGAAGRYLVPEAMATLVYRWEEG
ncbi:M16 family metallopeptidase [Serinicoccus kebangsaanensis]|uniref:M16 family metallopeptidase n=1 Tax=Serinicoccus kebangsaanensis TaxID=2602069 RepID=UPI00124CED4D|nr:pitrilysin family protein [Serinicoccus kebangsaanensis]